MAWPPRFSGQEIANELGLDHRLATEYLRRVRDKVLIDHVEIEHELVGIFGERLIHGGWKQTKMATSLYPEVRQLRLRQRKRERSERVPLRNNGSFLTISFTKSSQEIRFRIDWKTGLFLEYDSTLSTPVPHDHVREIARIGVGSLGPRLIYQYTHPHDGKRKHEMYLASHTPRFFFGQPGDPEDISISFVGLTQFIDDDDFTIGWNFLPNNIGDDRAANLTFQQRNVFSIVRWMFRNRGGGENMGPFWPRDEIGVPEE